MPHDDHGPGCDCGDFDHSLPDEKSLLPHINRNAIEVLNARSTEDVSKLFRPFNERHSVSCSIFSDDDDEDGSSIMVVKVSFASSCRLTSLRLIGGREGRFPKSVDVIANNELYDLSTVPRNAVQTVNLTETFCGTQDYPLKTAKLVNVHQLALHFEGAVDPAAKSIELNWLDIRGVNNGTFRKPVVAVYEARAQPADHEKLKSTNVALFDPLV